MATAAESDLTELFIRSYKCTGTVPPPLIGSSVTYLNGQAYVFGGRILQGGSGKLSSDIYICDLRTFVWRQVKSSEGGPAPRFFHSATGFQDYLVVFGGMGLDGSVALPASSNIQDDRQQQSFQMRGTSTKTLLGDMAVFDTRQETWVTKRNLANREAEEQDADENAPLPRYAHLATLLGTRLLLVGGQDLDEKYVEELNVFDLRQGRWVIRSPFPRAVGLYRSFVSSSQATTYLYSNYSFASVKRALYSLSSPPDCRLEELSDQLAGEPPGLRFPRGHMVDPQTVLMTGTLIATDGQSEMSVWVMDLESLAWSPVNCGMKFRAGSWNQSLVDPRTNHLVVFGDSSRDLNYDYQRRRLNYADIRTVDLRALGYFSTELQKADPLAGEGLMEAAIQRRQDSGEEAEPADMASYGVATEFMLSGQFGDTEVLAADGSKVATVNSGLLSARFPHQAQCWGQAARRVSAANPAANPAASPLSKLASAFDKDADSGMPKYLIDGSRDVVSILLFYLYTDRIDTGARFSSHRQPVHPDDQPLLTTSLLGDLLVLSLRYQLHSLSLRAANLLRRQITGATAPLVYEAALKADHQGLQAQCILALKDHVAVLRNDRKSPLYMISEAGRASLMRFFPKFSGSLKTSPARTIEDTERFFQYHHQQRDMIRNRSTSDTQRSGTMMASPVIHSPPQQSQKRLSTVSPLVNQMLPEETMVDYLSATTASDGGASEYSNGKRVSKYTDMAYERRPSDSGLQEPQQQSSSTRSKFFRPWNKMKKIASSSQVSSDNLPHYNP